jgi:ABC-type transporter Mla subunit MlaD
MLQALHVDVASARDELRATVVDAVAVAEGRLRKDLDLRDEMSQLVARVDTASAELDDHESDVLHALTRVAEAYELLAQRIDDDREERRMLILAIEHLAANVPAIGPPPPLRPARDRVLGGTVDPANAPQLDLTEDMQPDASAPSRRRRS